ncbi:MAG: hypothetical protein KF778_14285 [Rhodocyclaceae bacterium]|nr:hypothetical protein [Rhodocyclaceae bacterium]
MFDTCEPRACIGWRHIVGAAWSRKRMLGTITIAGTEKHHQHGSGMVRARVRRAGTLDLMTARCDAAIHASSMIPLPRTASAPFG